MSHCTSFTMTFNDKRILYRAMRELDWNPENQVWSHYSNQFAKKLGIGGDIIGKLLTGYKNGINVFFIEQNGQFQPHVESHELSPEQLEYEGAQLLNELRSAYLKHTVEALADKIRMSGNYTSIQENIHADGITYTVSLGAPGKTVQIGMNSEGQITEQVIGVQGSSCVDVTAGLEAKLYSATGQGTRQWTHEYHASVKDRQIQVLRLNQ